MRVDVGALGDAMAVAAVVGRDEVAAQQGIAGTGGDRLLPYRRVGGSFNHAALKQLRRPRLESADHQHGLEELLELGIVELRGVARRQRIRRAAIGCYGFPGGRKLCLRLAHPAIKAGRLDQGCVFHHTHPLPNAASAAALDWSNACDELGVLPVFGTSFFALRVP